MSSTETSNAPKFTVPRSVGVRRPLGRIQPGWWVHLEPNEGYDDAVPSWEQVTTVFETNRGNITLVVDVPKGDENAITEHKTVEAVTLTEREAKRYGLGAVASAASRNQRAEAGL